MKKWRNGQVSDSLLLGVFLTLAGGFQDAYSYNVRDHVFANAQTGNIVLLGQNLAQGNWSHAVRYLFPLLAFICGVYLTEQIRFRCRSRQRLHWRQVIVAAEVLLLAAAGLLPCSCNIAANVLLSFACAMQVDSFRKIKGFPCATTMCIGNMRSATEHLSLYHSTHDPAHKRASLHYYFIILIFAAGAAIGAVLSDAVGRRAIWIAAALLFAGFCLMFFQEQEKQA